MSAAGAALIRLRSLRQTRGWLGLARFLATRLARTQSDVVFEHELGTHPPSIDRSDFGEGRRLVTIDRSNLDDPAIEPVVRDILAGDSAAYRPGLEQGDMALAVVDQTGRVLHRSFIQFETRYKALLDELQAVPLIANCETAPLARGERLYPKTLRHAVALLASQGYRRAIITCDADNTASIRGILRAGFRETRAITSLVILFRLVLQRIRWTDQRTTWRIVRI